MEFVVFVGCDVPQNPTNIVLCHLQINDALASLLVLSVELVFDESRAAP